ncbi:MAG TPA: L,D-transpeptidase/peptidoglycan binding protein [Solirubrobacterales bacterium]|nr:L,D-transpeptidase/peptidoglycan binding protein [Solirubrobacterales bacterium]
MARKAKVAALSAVGALFVLVGAAFAYDDSQDDVIAEGITIGGVEVEGMDEAGAKRAVRRQLLAPLRHSLRVDYNGRHWTLDGAALGVRANLDRAAEEALDAGRSEGFLSRVVRYVSGGSVDADVPAGIAYSQAAVNRFVRHVAGEVDRAAQNAAVEPSGDSLEVTRAKYGRKLRDNLLTRQLRAAVLNVDAAHTIAARTHPVKPEVTAKEVAAQYPSYLTLDRDTFTLRLWEHLKPVKSYTVAVGQEGLETPEGLYAIQEKEENPSWHVPNSAWAGDLAGQVIPPGPDDPIKARWMGIYEGAGIHGTEETWSLGSAASHGCIRMSIPDVEELYDRVEVGTPIYIG